MTEKELIRELALIATGQSKFPRDHIARSALIARKWGSWPQSCSGTNILDFEILPAGWEALKKAADETSTL